MNKIETIFKKYFHNNTVSWEGIIYDKYNIPQSEATNIILYNVPCDETILYEYITPLILNRPCGGSIFMEDVGVDIIKTITSRFNTEDPEHNNNITGVCIVYIVDVGYIITNLKDHTHGIFSKTYTLDEYNDKSKEYIVMGMAKQEGHYVKDWVAYHIHAGFDKIYLFDNNDEDGESYDELLEEYVDSGKLCIVDIRGKRGVQNDTYNMFYYTCPFKWCAVVDIDEFIWINEISKYNNIKDFIDDLDTLDVYDIILQWHCYQASGEIKPSDLPIWEANNKPLPFESRKDCRCEYINDWCKSIYRKGYPIVMNEHFGWVASQNMIKNPRLISCYGEDTWKNQLSSVPYDKFINQPVYIKHFLLRNIGDFYYKKYLRGHAGLSDNEGHDGWRFWQWCQNMNYFTDITPILSQEEQLFMRERGMKINYTFHPDMIINLYTLPNNDYINNNISNILANEILPNTNTCLNEYVISTGNFELLKQTYTKDIVSHYDFSFLSSEHNNSSYFNTNMNDEGYLLRKFIQEPIIINIGVPLDWAINPLSEEEQENYYNQLSTLLCWDNIKPLIRRILETGETILPSFCIGHNQEYDYFGWKDSLIQFLEPHGIPLSDLYLDNNTYITTLSQYQKIKKYQKLFVDYHGMAGNEFILNNIKNEITTPYHAYIASVLAVIDKPFYVWRNE